MRFGGDFDADPFPPAALGVVLSRLPATFELGLTAFVLAASPCRSACFGGAAKLGGRPDRREPGARRPVGADVLHRHSPDPDRLAEARPPADLGPGDWRHLVLPALTLGAFAMASIARLTRSAVLEVLRADYVRTARQGRVGDPGRAQAHAQERGGADRDDHRLQFGTLLGGAVVTETVFAWPGIGRLAIQSIYNRDYPVVQCTVFLSAVLFIVINFCIDLIYGLLDPASARVEAPPAVRASRARRTRWMALGGAHSCWC